ncbi:CCGSCS motif protein [Vibrio superstes]|nr:CCGSCS motif protein [Vibrio superstes]
MNFSVKKLFGKKDNQSENAVLTKQQNAQPKTDTQEAPKKKHGEPGVCCGSCS